MLNKSYWICCLGALLLNFAEHTHQTEVYTACQNDFAIGDKNCAKFDFGDGHQRECINPKNGTTFYDISMLPNVTFINPRTRKMASLITNVFEEGTTNFAFASCVDIGDLRGYTCGYVGFTTGTNDAETVIKAYTDVSPNNTFLPFLDRLSEIGKLPFCDRDGRGSTKGLEGFPGAWQTEACNTDAKFSTLQKDWTYRNYMIPSARYAAAYGINSALGQAIFYDTIIQHGYQYVENDINIVRILELTGSRQDNESEQSYLTRFLTIRRQLQCCYPDDVWPDSATRSEDLQGLVDQFDLNKDLKFPVLLKNFEQQVNGTEEQSIDQKRCTAVV